MGAGVSDSTEADEKVHAFILRNFRADGIGGDATSTHMRQCDSLRVVSHEMYDGEYGCDTGCECARLEAKLACGHGYTTDHEYGTFGEVSDILADIFGSDRALAAEAEVRRLTEQIEQGER